jgi:predicted DNA-binding protein (MmcQ/YjbR family)
MKLQYNKYVKVNDKYTFGYKWINLSENERQLYFGRSGKGFCVGVTYDKTLGMAFKDNSGYFKSCNEENNLPRGKEGTYKMIYAAIFMVLDRYPDAKLLSWQDNTMITIKGNDISLSDSDTILYGRPRIIDIVGDHSVKDNFYRPFSRDMLITLSKKKQLVFERFWKKYYSRFDEFDKNEIVQLSNIYNKSQSLLAFFKESDTYLSKVNKKKWIFLSLRDILRDNEIESFVNTTWVLDIKTAAEHVNVKVDKLISQTGGGSSDTYNVHSPKVRIRHVDGPSGDMLYINSSYYYIDTLKRFVT